MSDFAVEIVTVDAVEKHPNADRLELLKIKDWQCVSQIGTFKAGDRAIYFPIDSILPGEVESELFGPDSKVKLHKSRVKTIRLRGAISQGMAVKSVGQYDANEEIIGTDLTAQLGVTKYSPPEVFDSASFGGGTKKTRKKESPYFAEYTRIQNAKNYPEVFTGDDIVVVSEKIHGTNFRAGWAPYSADTWWKKVKSFFGLAPGYEFVYGSHHVQLQNKPNSKGGFYSTDVYSEAVEKYSLRDRIPVGHVVYGEIYGDGIQKGYTYGCEKDERKLIVFDIAEFGSDKKAHFLNLDEALKLAKAMGIPWVPLLYLGNFDKTQILAMRDGPSVLCPEQKVREGVVVKPIFESACHMGRKILKFISDLYLLKNQDDESIAH